MGCAHHNSSTTDSAIRALTVIASIADPTVTEKKISHRRIVYSPQEFIIAGAIDDNSDLNYDFARATGCNRQYRTWYATLGGKLMLVYDAGALNDSGFYAAGKSRFSALAGVDYVVYDTQLDRMVGFSPAVGTQAQLDALHLPPGKYVPWHRPCSRSSSSPRSMGL